MEPDALNNDLQAFRAEWKRELHSTNSSRIQTQDAHSCKDEPVHAETETRPNDGTSNLSYYEESEAPFPFQFADSLMRGWQEASPLEKETAKRSRCVEAKPSASPAPTVKKQRRSLVDEFIDDLNELDGIPFFDMELPREIALKIFRYLDPRSLCKCAMVSHAWQNLANDDYLWEGLYYSMTTTSNLQINSRKADGVSWKDFYRNAVSNNNGVQLNWKEHKCHVTYYHHARGGILTCVDSYGDYLVAGYTNGQVKLWNVITEESQTLSSSNQSLVLIEEETEVLGTSENFVSSLKLGEDGKVLAGYNHGQVQLWHSGDADKMIAVEYPGFSIKSVAFSHDSSLCYVQLVHSLNRACDIKVLHLNSEAVTTVDSIAIRERNSNWTLPQVMFSPVPAAAKPSLLYVGRDKVYIHASERRWNDFVTTENVVEEFCATHFTCLEASRHHLSVGLTSHLGIHAEYKVRCYDPHTLKHNFDLRSHTSQVTCVDNSYHSGFIIATGCHDRRVRLFDSRLPTSNIRTFMGHSGSVECIQADEWKIISGDVEGYVCVWDQRKCAKLWETQSRHPVKYLKFSVEKLIAANIPRASSRCEFEVDSERMTHLRYRGRLQLCDFSTSQAASNVPSICSSNYDMPEGSTYNLALITPYDSI